MTRAAQTTIALSDDDIAMLFELFNRSASLSRSSRAALIQVNKQPDCYQQLAHQRSKGVCRPSAMGLLRRKGQDATGPAAGASTEDENSRLRSISPLNANGSDDKVALREVVHGANSS